VQSVISTLGREGQQLTWSQINELAPRWRHQVITVAPEGESHQGCVWYHPPSCTHIGLVRQWILERSPSSNVIMVDDDMWIFKRIAGPGTLEKATDLDELFDQLQDWMDQGFVHGGVKEIITLSYQCSGQS
jgi:hypothetical protein